MKCLCSICLLWILGSCAASRNAADSNLSGNWSLVLFPGSDKSFSEIFGDRKPQLQFNTADHSVSGTTGCNRLRTTYSVKGGQFRFDEHIITTKMACADYEENTFLNALTKVNRYSVEKNQLRLLQDSTLVMVFAKE